MHRICSWDSFAVRNVLTIALLLVSLLAVQPAQSAIAQAPAAEAAELDSAFQALVSLELGQSLASFQPIVRAVGRAQTDESWRADLEARLLAVLQGDATDLAKDFACRQLATVGSDSAVPHLASLLANPRLAHMSRWALEGIGSAAACTALREAVSATEGQQQVGVVISLGRLSDAQSVNALAGLLDKEDGELRDATLIALGRIGTQDAADVLQAFAARAPEELSDKLLDAILQAAQLLCERQQHAAAAEVLSPLLANDSPRVAAAAFRGLLTAQPADTIALLLQGLGSDIQWKRAVAADYLTELKQPDQVEAVASRLAQLPPAGQVAAFISLRDCRDAAIRESAIRAVEHADADVCVAALGALIQNASAEDVPLLIVLLTTAEPSEVRTAAFETLRRMPAAGTNEALRQWMDASEDLPAAVVRCAGARRSPLLVPVLLKAAGASEQAARLEAFNALEIMATHEHAAELVTLLCHSQPGEEREAADRAVWMSCQQISDPTQRTAPLLKALEQADAAAKCAILPSLGRMGGEAALAAVQDAMQSEDPAVRDAGYRALANWPDASVADQLLEIARTHQVESYRIWSLRAYARVVALASERDPLETYRMLDEAMGLATRVEDKRLFVERLAAVRVPEALTRLLSLLDDPDLKEIAVAATFTLAKGLSQSHPDQAREALTKILPLTTDPVLQQQIPKVLRDIESPNAQPQN